MKILLKYQNISKIESLNSVDVKRNFQMIKFHQIGNNF